MFLYNGLWITYKLQFETSNNIVLLGKIYKENINYEK